MPETREGRRTDNLLLAHLGSGQISDTVVPVRCSGRVPALHQVGIGLSSEPHLAYLAGISMRRRPLNSDMKRSSSSDFIDRARIKPCSASHPLSTSKA